MLNLRSSKGFTLVEVILVVLILGILAAIVVPRITYSRDQARREACNSNVSTINAMIEYAHVVDGVAYPTTNDGLNTFLANATYFPDGAPVCPFGTAYTINATTSRVPRHTH